MPYNHKEWKDPKLSVRLSGFVNFVGSQKKRIPFGDAKDTTARSLDDRWESRGPGDGQEAGGHSHRYDVTTR